MRAVLQRVSRAQVTVDGGVVGAIEGGILVLLGIAAEDTLDDLNWMVRKVAELRFFEDADGKMNLSVEDVGGAVLVVSQFTLYGDCRKGRRPSFIAAAEPAKAVEYYEKFCEELTRRGIKVATGQFRAHMDVELVNDGPVTLLVDSRADS
ncbi:MAG: D-tyrosyl-tRNA(Tyr) deacylase [Planctomycetaceae bacterium]|nr:D-tyrosyl-tRNA(Tyr) deacylase [Planctomycetaceae bacterium]